jgi:hypothetical protein
MFSKSKKRLGFVRLPFSDSHNLDVIYQYDESDHSKGDCEIDVRIREEKLSVIYAPVSGKSLDWHDQNSIQVKGSLEISQLVS